MIKTEDEAIEYWNKRFKRDKDVGWGSRKKSKWYNQKKDAIAHVLKTGNVKRVLDICCGDCKFIAELPEFQDGSIEYVGIEPSKVIYDQITKDYPDKTFLNITPSELIETDMNDGQFDLIICYDFLFHIAEDELYNNFIKWMFNRNAGKYIILSFDDVNKKDQRSEEGHYIPRKFSAGSLGYWWKTIYNAASLEHKSMKLHIFEIKKRPIGDMTTYKPMRNYYMSGRIGIGSHMIHELETIKFIEQACPDIDMVVELGTFHGGLTLQLSDSFPNIPIHTFDFFIMDGWKAISEHIEGMDTNIHFHHEDILSSPNKNLVDILQLPGKKFLYADNGDKPKEINMYAKYLKSGDIIGTHDWNVEIKMYQIENVLSDFVPILHKEMEGLLTRLWIKK